MKLIKKYLFMIAVLSTALTGCAADVAGIIAGYVNDGLSSNYFLKDLSVDAPALYDEEDPNATKLNFTYSFDSTTWNYALHVPNSIDIITITPTKDHRWADIYLNEVNPANMLVSGSPSGPINLNEGLNVIKAIVVAQDQQQMRYTINVTRHTAAYADATLSSLGIEGVELSPAFNPNITTYSGSVNTGAIKVTAVPNSAEFKKLEIFANGIEYHDLTAIPVAGGMNVIEARCTSGSGDTRIYTINILKPLETPSADLVALSIRDKYSNEISLDPAFDRDITSYIASMGKANSPISLVAQAESSTATPTVIVNTIDVTAHLNSIDLNEGRNDIDVEVYNASSSETKTYSIVLNCTTASKNADLKSLRVGLGTISSRPIHPGTFVRDATYHDSNDVKFYKQKYEYVTVIYGFSSMNITAATDDPTAQNVEFTALRYDGITNAVSTQNYNAGTGTATINLDAGRVTTVTITVTAASGDTKDYTLYAKLLNVDEFYWGIYGPSMDKSKTTWTKPQPGTFERPGYVAGTVKWVVTTQPKSTLTLTGYNDGKLGFVYNDGGFIVNGAHEAILKSISVKDGWDLTLNPPFLLKTAAGEYVAELDYHLWIKDGEPTEAENSYTGIKYLSDEWHIQTFKNNKPYPFGSGYNWFESWSDGQSQP